MSKSIPRKPVPGETDLPMDVPARISSKRAKTRVVSDSSASSNNPNAKVNDHAQDMGSLAPLVSRLSIEGSAQDPQVAVASISDANRRRRSASLSRQLAPTWPIQGKGSPPVRSRSGRQVKRSSLDKPLPKTPPVDILDTMNLQAHPGVRPSTASQPRADQTLSSARSAGILKGARSEGNLRQKKVTAKDLDFTDSVDTAVTTKQANAVTHETIRRDIHEIRHERITRDLHEHHVFHRILPIVDVEIKPARHFLDIGGKLHEIPPDRLPDGPLGATKYITIELPQDSSAPGPRKFTARDFPGTEGDYIEKITPAGTKQTERWWVHPPTLETGGKKTGQTRPFHLGYADPTNDGFRDDALEFHYGAGL